LEGLNERELIRAKLSADHRLRHTLDSSIKSFLPKPVVSYLSTISVSSQPLAEIRFTTTVFVMLGGKFKHDLMSIYEFKTRC